MTKEEKLYIEIGQSLQGAEQSQMFGKPCYKINGKTFICFIEKTMLFKLSDTIHKIALSLDGAQLLDPSGQKRPTKEWVQLSYIHKDKWSKYARAAMDYVKASQ